MPSKAVMAQEIQRQLARGDVSDDFELTVHDIYVLIDLALDKAIKDNIRENEALRSAGQGRDEDFNSEFLKRISISSITDEGGQYIAALPISIRTLPGDMGLYLLGNEHLTDIYTRISPSYFERFQGLEMADMNTEVLYYLQGKNIYLFSLPSTNCTLTALVFPDTASMDENEELPIPSGYEQQVFDDAMQRASTMLLEPQDKVNDANGQK